MSYIDTFDHEYLGDFADIPLYHPIVNVEGSGDRDFSCSPDNLVLGGGDGEHLGLVFHRLDCLALRYVIHAIPDGEESLSIHDQFADFPIMDYLEFEYSSLFEYAGWSVRDFHAFYERGSSSDLNLPYDEKDDSSFEDWLALSIGEFVWFELPDLIQDLQPVRMLYPELKPIAGNVLMAHPGSPKKYGRKVIEGEVVWGHVRSPAGGDLQK
jgi:hypothetical protein